MIELIHAAVRAHDACDDALIVHHRLPLASLSLSHACADALIVHHTSLPLANATRRAAEALQCSTRASVFVLLYR